MKKLFMMIALLASSFTAMADDAISASLKVDSDKSSATVHVNLDNTTATYVAFQFDITFPAELGTLTNDNAAVTTRLVNGGTVDLSAAGGTASESTDFIIATNWLPGNKLRVLGYNLGNKPIEQTSGEILTIKINATNPPANASDWTAKFDAVDFVTESELQEVLLAVTNPESTATGEEDAAWLMGDVNHDTKVTLADAVAALKYFLLGNDVEAYKASTGKEFYPAQADLNNDHTVTLADAVAILKLSI